MVQGVWKHGHGRLLMQSTGDFSSFQALVDQDEDTGRFGRREEDAEVNNLDAKKNKTKGDDELQPLTPTMTTTKIGH